MSHMWMPAALQASYNWQRCNATFSAAKKSSHMCSAESRPVRNSALQVTQMKRMLEDTNSAKTYCSHRHHNEKKMGKTKEQLTKPVRLSALQGNGLIAKSGRPGFCLPASSYASDKRCSLYNISPHLWQCLLSIISQICLHTYQQDLKSFKKPIM